MIRIHNFPGQLLPHHHCKKCLPNVLYKSCFIQLKPLPLVLSVLGKFSFHASHKLLLFIKRPQSGLPLVQAAQSQLSASLHSRGAPALRAFLRPSSDPSLTNPHLSCTGGPRTGCSSGGGVPPEQRGSITTLNLLVNILN